jgi:type III pantothenate kinase
MYLIIDAGNTRIKYAAHDGRGWLFHGVTSSVEPMLDLPDIAWQGALAASVVSPAVNAQLSVQCQAHGASLAWFASSAAACGVRNGYSNPAQLGVDRWAAVIAAWHRVRGPCLVVNAGTATTVDVLNADGVFAGGCILPGFEMMRRALAEGTARLPMSEGQWQAVPTNTADAIHAGCLNAQLGAIERMQRQLPADAPVLLAGGAAESLREGLREAIAAPLVETPHLVLEGLLAALR